MTNRSRLSRRHLLAATMGAATDLALPARGDAVSARWTDQSAPSHRGMGLKRGSTSISAMA